jgi:hypothetical protein
MRSPEKVGNDDIQDSGLQFIDGMGLTLPQLCQNYWHYVVESVKSTGSERRQTLRFIHLMTNSDT